MAAITLDDVVLEQMETNETLGNLKEQTIIMFQMQNQGLGTLITQFDEFLGMVRTQMRIADEARREQSVLPPPPQSPPPKGDGEPAGGGGMGFGLTGVASAIAFATGAVAGFYAMIRKNFKGTITAIENFAKFIKNQVARIGQFFKGLGARIFRFLDFSKGAKEMGELLSKAFAPIKGFFTRIANNPIVKFFGRLGQLVGRLAYPIFLAIDIFKGIMGELDNMDEQATIGDKIVAAFEGFTKGLIKFLMFPVDVIKDVAGWIAGLLGFDDTKGFLDSFSFGEGAVDLVDMMYEKLNGLGTWLGGAIFDMVQWVGSIPEQLTGFVNQAIDDLTSKISEIGSMALNGIKNLVLAALPPADFATFELPEADLGILGKFGGGVINLNPIPSSVYEWAGSGSTGSISGDTNSTSNTSNLSSAIGGTNNSSTVTNAINQESVANAGNSQSSTVVIQDNSVSSAQTNNTQATSGSGRSMPSPTNDNRTRASAYAG